jgi:hypothetical protein
MRLRQPNKTVTENLGLFRVEQHRQLRAIRSDMTRLEWAMRWKRFKQWLQRRWRQLDP